VRFVHLCIPTSAANHRDEKSSEYRTESADAMWASGDNIDARLNASETIRALRALGKGHRERATRAR
jgi:hypothetical protein